MEAKLQLEVLLKPVDSDPMGSENEPHHYTYKPTLDPEQDTVIAAKESSELAEPPVSEAQKPVRREPPERGSVLKLSPDELARLAPRLRSQLRRSDPNWRDIVDAADWLRHELDVSKSLWADACSSMGRERAAIALAIVSTKDPEDFKRTAGGHFHGMVAKDKAGELNLDRTIWALRRAADQSRRPGTGRGADRSDRGVRT